MKKNGFSVVDAIVIVALLSITAIFIIARVSNALKENDNSDEMYNYILQDYLEIATIYGESIKDDVKKGENNYITVNELVQKGYIHTDTTDIRDDNKTMDDIKFKLVYDANTDKVYAQVD